MRILSAIVSMFYASVFVGPLAQGQIDAGTCSQFADPELTALSSSFPVFTAQEWKDLDVISGYNRLECQGAVRRSLIQVGGQDFVRFETLDDLCDGGNTFGSIYHAKTNEVVAHIYDGDIICDATSFQPELQAQFHKCDLLAEKAVEGAVSRTLGLEFSAEASSLELRRDITPYAVITVAGFIPQIDRRAEVAIDVNVESCSFRRVRVTNINL